MSPVSDVYDRDREERERKVSLSLIYITHIMK
jgi:hypothetical protein